MVLERKKKFSKDNDFFALDIFTVCEKKSDLALPLDPS